MVAPGLLQAPPYPHALMFLIVRSDQHRWPVSRLAGRLGLAPMYGGVPPLGGVKVLCSYRVTNRPAWLQKKSGSGAALPGRFNRNNPNE